LQTYAFGGQRTARPTNFATLFVNRIIPVKPEFRSWDGRKKAQKAQNTEPGSVLVAPKTFGSSEGNFAHYNL
jgi:hypothetical protein